MWSNWAENAKSSMTQALEKTGDALSKAATNAGKSARKKKEDQERSGAAGTPPPATETTNTEADTSVGASPAPAPAPAPPVNNYDQPTIAAIPDKRQDFFNNLSQGWTNVVQTTRASMKQAEEKVKEQQMMLQERISKARSAYYKRDPSLPLDVEALKDAEVVYITDRIITMGHPAMPSPTNPDISGERKLAAVGHMLSRRHGGRFMVWNMSEVEYNVDILDDQVLTFTFPGSPSPPLGLLLKLLVSMESWLKADERNVAVVHCLTGKGRTSTVLAAFLCWMGEAQFHDIYEALEYIAKCKQITAEELTIPSQRRYASYFKNMLDGVRPSQTPLMLRRVIMSEAPRYAKGPPRIPKEGESDDNKKNDSKPLDETQLLGCVPYIQIFKSGKLLHTAPASLHFQQAENELPFCQVADGNISFHVNLVVQGDILVRARHLTAKKKRISMFRTAFHTGYAPANVMRLTKSQLDGACLDDRFPDDFFLDFIFESVDVEEASKLLSDGDSQPESGEGEAGVADAGKRANAVRASADDSMLHRDSRFWDVISTRMKQHAADNEGQTDPSWGPTVGRRRDFSGKDADYDSGEAKGPSEQERTALETFSIGGELDFLPENVEPEPSGVPVSPESAKPSVPKKDSLMEALMGALDDSGRDEEMVEFDEVQEVNQTTTPESKESSKAETATAATAGTDKQSTEEKPSTVASQQEANSKPPAADATDDMEKLLADANLDVGDDMDALLAGAGDGTGDDLLDLDIDDTDLDDLESFLSKPSK